jgi:hypothetical protein
MKIMNSIRADPTRGRREAGKAWDTGDNGYQKKEEG